MLNFNVPLHIQRERLNTCKKCKFFVESTSSCGTLIAGAGTEVDPEENSVTYYKEKIKLCGCFMPLKVKFRFTSCPAHKWFALDWKQNEIAALDEFIKRIHKANKIESEDLKLLYYWFSKVTGKHEQPSGCASCIRDLITEFRRQLGKIETK
jgi:hypothetical protein